MSNDPFNSMQSVNCVYEQPTTRGWVHGAMLTYILCALVVAMSITALVVRAAEIEQPRLAKHHP